MKPPSSDDAEMHAGQPAAGSAYFFYFAPFTLATSQLLVPHRIAIESSPIDFPTRWGGRTTGRGGSIGRNGRNRSSRIGRMAKGDEVSDILKRYGEHQSRSRERQQRETSEAEKAAVRF